MKTFYLSIAALFFSIISASVVDAQPLTDLEKNTLVEYWALDPKLSGFSGAAKEMVLSDRANTNDLRICAKSARQYNTIKEVFELRQFETDRIYEKIAINFPAEFLKKVFPDFNKTEFVNFKALAAQVKQKGGGDLWYNDHENFEGARYVWDDYADKRKEHFTKDNAYAIMELKHPEEIKILEAKKDIKRASNLSGRSVVIHVLEYNYVILQYMKAFDIVDDELQKLENSLVVCNARAATLLSRAMENPRRFVVVRVEAENDRGITELVAAAKVEFLDLQVTIETATDGMCSVEHFMPDGKSISVRVTKEGYKPALGYATISRRERDKGFEHINVTLEKKRIKNVLKVSVKDKNGDPVESANLTFPDGLYVTDSYGNFDYEHSNPDGQALRIEVEKKGYKKYYSIATTGKPKSIILEDDEPDFDYLKFSGTWQSDFGPVQLTVSKGGVSGSWKQNANETGEITDGSVDPKSKTISFNYSQPWNNKKGKVTDIRFSEDATRYVLRGYWRHDDKSDGGWWWMWRNK